MGAVDELKRLSSAEDFFAALEVPFEPAVLARARLHILRRMGESLGKLGLEGSTDDATARKYLREALESAYRDFTTSTPLKERVFKVHKDARRALLPFKRRG